MLDELVTKYYLEKEEIKKTGVKGDKLEEIIRSLTNENLFKNLDVKTLLEFLEEAGYTTYSRSQLETTLDYMKRNNLFNNKAYILIIKEILESLKTLKPNYYNLDELNSLLERILKLQNSIRNTNTFITDFPLIEDIIKEYNLNTSDIYNIMLEIDRHNKRIAKGNNVLDILIEYGYNNELISSEETILNSISKEEIEEKLKYLNSKIEFNFLKEPILNRRLILILLAPLSNIKEILNISKKTNLSLESIFPIFYLNNDFKLESDDSFYNNVEGCFETFTKNIKLLNDLGYNINEVYENFSNLFYTKSEDLVSNLEIYTKYNINIPIPSALVVDDLEYKLDRFIELGLYSYIKSFPQTILNKDKAFFSRIYYARKNLLPVKKRYLVKEITSLNGYMINEENYQELVPTYKPIRFETEFYNKLEGMRPNIIDNRVITSLLKVLDDNYMEEDNVYNIEGTLISRNKVIRLFQSFLNNNTNNINYFEGLLFAITSNTLISKDDFDSLVSNIVNKYVESNTITNNDANNLLEILDINTRRGIK